MKNIKYGLFFLGILILVVFSILLLVNLISEKAAAIMFLIGVGMILISMMLPTQLCRGLP